MSWYQVHIVCTQFRFHIKMLSFVGLLTAPNVNVIQVLVADENILQLQYALVWSGQRSLLPFYTRRLLFHLFTRVAASNKRDSLCIELIL